MFIFKEQDETRKGFNRTDEKENYRLHDNTHTQRYRSVVHSLIRFSNQNSIQLGLESSFKQAMMASYNCQQTAEMLSHSFTS